MRLISVFLLSCLASIVFAADTAQAPDWKPLPPPPVLEPLPQDGDLEPEVKITKQTDTIIEEYRVGGKLYMIKVTPKVGFPYFMIDDNGDGNFSRQDSPEFSRMRPPRWVIHRF